MPFFPERRASKKGTRQLSCGGLDQVAVDQVTGVVCDKDPHSFTGPVGGVHNRLDDCVRRRPIEAVSVHDPPLSTASRGYI